MITNHVFIRASTAALLLPGSSALAQTRAAESTNFEFDLESTDRDTSGSTSNGTLGGSIAGTIPIGSWFAAPLSGGYSTTRVRTYTVGTLVLDMFDASTKRAIWRGTASGTVSDSPEKNQAAVEAALDKMLSAFPPGSVTKPQ